MELIPGANVYFSQQSDDAGNKILGLDLPDDMKIRVYESLIDDVLVIDVLTEHDGAMFRVNVNDGQVFPAMPNRVDIDEAFGEGRGEVLDFITELLYPIDEEPESDWDAPGICEALAEYLKERRPDAYKRQVYRCEVAITNVYNGVEKVSYHLVPEPDGEPTDAWWEEHVWPLTGTGEAADRAAISSGYFGEIIQSHNSFINGSEHEWV